MAIGFTSRCCNRLRFNIVAVSSATPTPGAKPRQSKAQQRLGANNALRADVSYLGRKSLAFARSLHWLQARLYWFIHHWNLRQAKKYD